jgi:hypothetical protein
MRHPAAPTIIAILLGFLAVVVIFHTLVDYGHHEGNPRKEDIPTRDSVIKKYEEMEGHDSEGE